MKKSLFLLVLALAVTAGTILYNRLGQCKQMSVDKYFAAVAIAPYTPLYIGEFPNLKDNPVYDILRNDRHLVFILNVPAEILKKMVLDETGTIVEPKISLIQNGQRLYPIRVVPWPVSERYDTEMCFFKPETLHTKADDPPFKKYRIALNFHSIQKDFLKPFDGIQIGDYPLVPVPEDKCDLMFKWH